MEKDHGRDTACALVGALDSHLSRLIDAAIERRFKQSMWPDLVGYAGYDMLGPNVSDSVVAEGSLTIAAPSAAQNPQKLYVYVAGARGAATLGRQHGCKVFKIGTTQQPIETRLKEIAKDRYGAAVRRGAETVIQPGFEGWVAQVIHATRRPGDPAVSLSPRAIGIALPATMTTRRFDQALHAALSTRALPIDPKRGLEQRLTVYSIGATSRISAASEFYKFDPAADADMLLDVVEGILRRHRATPG